MMEVVMLNSKKYQDVRTVVEYRGIDIFVNVYGVAVVEIMPIVSKTTIRNSNGSNRLLERHSSIPEWMFKKGIKSVN